MGNWAHEGVSECRMVTCQLGGKKMFPFFLLLNCYIHNLYLFVHVCKEISKYMGEINKQTNKHIMVMEAQSEVFGHNR